MRGYIQDGTYMVMEPWDGLEPGQEIEVMRLQNTDDSVQLILRRIIDNQIHRRVEFGPEDDPEAEFETWPLVPYDIAKMQGMKRQWSESLAGSLIRKVGELTDVLEPEE